MDNNTQTNKFKSQGGDIIVPTAEIHYPTGDSKGDKDANDGEIFREVSGKPDLGGTGITKESAGATFSALTILSETPGIVRANTDRTSKIMDDVQALHEDGDEGRTAPGSAAVEDGASLIGSGILEGVSAGKKFEIKSLAEMDKAKFQVYLKIIEECEATKQHLADQCNLQIDRLAVILDDQNMDPAQIIKAQDKLAHLYFDRYEALSDFDDLDSAFKLGQNILSDTSTGDSELSARQSFLGLVHLGLSWKFETEEDQKYHTEKAIEYLETALAVILPEHPDYYSWQISLASAHLQNYDLIQDITELDVAIQLGELIIHQLVTPNDRSTGLLMLEKAYFYKATLEDRDDPFLNQALECGLNCLECIDIDHPNFIPAAFQLRKIYAEACNLQPNVEDEEQRLKYWWLAGNPTSAELSQMQAQLGFQYGTLYQKTDDLVDLELALKYNQLALENIPFDDPELSKRYAALGVTYSFRYQKLNNMSDLEESLKCDQLAFQNTPFDDPDMFQRYAALAVSYNDYFEAMDNIDDLKESLRYEQLSLEKIPPDHPEVFLRHAALGITYTSLYDKLGNPSDLQGSIKHNKLALEQAPSDYPEIFKRYAALGACYNDLYKKLGNIDDLIKSLEYNKSALNNIPVDHPDIYRIYKALEISYGHQYKILGDTTDLKKSVKYKELAVKTTSSKSRKVRGPKLTTYQQLKKLADLENQISSDDLHIGISDVPVFEKHTEIGEIYQVRYLKLGNIGDLNTSLQYKKMALAEIPSGHPNVFQKYADLGEIYQMFYTRFEKISDFDESLKYKQLALDKIPSDHPLLFQRYAALGVAFSQRYSKLRVLIDIEESLRLKQLALKTVPLNHPQLFHIYAILGNSYQSRYEKLGDIADLEESLKYKKLALEKIPPNHSNVPEIYTALGVSFKNRYERLYHLADLGEALKYRELSLINTPLDDPKLGHKHQSLGLAYLEWYVKLWNISDINEALRHCLLALNKTVDDLPEIFKNHSALGIIYRRRYERLGDMNDLESSIIHQKLAVEKIPPSNPDELHCLYLSVSIHHFENLEFNSSKDCNYIISLAKRSTLAVSSATSWLYLVNIGQIIYSYDPQVAFNIYAKAFETFADLAWIGSSLSTRHFQLWKSNVHRKIAYSTSVAIELNEPIKAIEFLEQGLAVTSQQYFELHDEYKDFLKQYPAEAEQLKKLSEVISKQSEIDDASVRSSVNLAAIKRKDLIASIRTKPGLENFLKSPMFSHLSVAASGGPVILLNCTELRADAIIIFSAETTLFEIVKLDITPNDIKEQLDVMKQAFSTYNVISRDVNRAIHRRRPLFNASEHQASLICGWIKDKIVLPVYQILQKNNVHSGRIWWCTSGIMTHLPVHAGAPEDSPYIQSYTPSLQSLIQARKAKIPGSSKVMTAVGVPKTLIDLSLNPLDGVNSEMEIISTTFGQSNVNILMDVDASADKVLESMKSATLLHLACHGTQNMDNPLKSCLYLQDKTLELSTILDTEMPSAKFVFLSACQTAMGDAKVVNESMHLSGAFITAGFQGAIGTLWNISDSDAPYVAKIVYKKILEGDTSEPNVALAAEGLHTAIKNLRNMGATYQRWVPFIHFGI